MKNRSSYAVLTRFGIIAAVLATLVLIAPAASAADPVEFDYAENGTDPVATFNATDADGDEITWSLKGTDKDDFEIEGGVLTFKKSPNYESPTDRDEDDDSAGDQGKGDNVYKIAVVATSDTSAEQAVEVTVTDVDEDGSVTFTQVQPQDTVSLTAELSDDDGVKSTPAKTWQWSRGPSATGPWTDIAGATKAKRTPVTDDVGNYLRAVVSYTDSFGAKTAEGVTDYPVEAETKSNAAPSFADLDEVDGTTGVQITRDANENTKGNLGDPLTATDADNDILRYSITGGSDKDCFSIDKTSGQLSLNAERDFETPTAECKKDGGARTSPNNANDDYTVVVTATDPSNATGDATVTLTIKDVNEAAEFEKPDSNDATDADGRETLYIHENAKGASILRLSATTGTTQITYTAKDKDTGDDDDAIRYTVEGPDRKHFTVSDATPGILTAKTDTKLFGTDDKGANYEKKSSYSITIVATSGGGSTTDRKVGNVDRTRYARLDVTIKVVNQDDVGTVKLSAREPQEGKSVTAKLSDEDGGETDVTWQWYRGGAGPLDGGDGFGDGELANITACSAINVGSNSQFCLIPDATSPVYTPVADDEDLLIHALAKYKDSIGTTYEYAVKASEAEVQEDNPANTAPKFKKDNDPNTPGDQDPVRSVEENKKDADVGAVLSLTDADDDLMEVSISDTTNFSVDNNAQIKTKVKLDYEALPEDDKTYTVVVTAVDPSGATGSTNVIINVIDVDDPAEISGDDKYTYAENGTDAVATFTATDQDGDDIEWSLEGVDKDVFEIDEDTGELTFKDSPNFEGAKDKDEVAETEELGDQGAGDNKYQITVVASKGKHEVEVEVTDVDEAGKVTFDQPQPQATVSLEAEFSDQDGETKPSWQWSRGSSADGPWTDIAGATTAKRIPTTDDVGNYLRAVVSYTDTFGSQTAEGVTDNPVEEETRSNAKPSFKDQDENKDTKDVIEVTRSVKENVKGDFGDPVEATDDDEDVLLYSLKAVTGEDARDKDCFDIDNRSGQLSLNAERNYEDTNDACKDGGTARNDNDNSYVVIVTATDPSGASEDQRVTVTVTDVNESPEFNKASKDKATVYIAENLTTPAIYSKDDLTGDVVGSYTAEDNDGTTKDNAPVYTIEGADKDSFSIVASDGTLTSAADDTATTDKDESLKADFEKKASYSITIVATTTGAGGDNNPTTEKRYGRLDVTVKVVDGEDDGTVKLDAREPQEGKSVTAELTDEDGGETDVTWQWYRGDLIDTTADTDTDENECPAATYTTNPSDFRGWQKIDGATAPVYTPASYTFDHDNDDPNNDGKKDASPDDPATAQVGYCLRAKVEYTDDIANTGDAKDVAYGIPERAVQEDDPANTAPKFPEDNDPNMPGNQPDAERSVKENAKDANVGEPVDVTDTDLVMFSLGGADAASFKLGDPSAGSNSVQIMTAVALDYEALPEDDKTYTVVLTATDPSGATDSINVVITVTDEDDPPSISLIPGGPVAPTHPCIVGGAVTADGGADLANDCQILLDAAPVLIGDGTATLNWSAETPIGDWDGVSSRDGTSRVYSIWLRGGHAVLGGGVLSGTIPAGLNGLDALVKLQLPGNDLTGEIPDLSDLDVLTHLVLNDNDLSGSVPSSLGGMAELDYLYLHRNDLSGSIPVELGNATRLRRLHLHENDLTGEIPSELGNLSRLRYLILSANMLTGEIPSELSNATNVKLLYLDNNMLTGSIPAELGSIMTNAEDTLKRLYLHDNDLSGDVPSELGNLDLSVLLLSGNSLTGCIPAAIFDAADDAAAAGLSACE